MNGFLRAALRAARKGLLPAMLTAVFGFAGAASASPIAYNFNSDAVNFGGGSTFADTAVFGSANPFTVGELNAGWTQRSATSGGYQYTEVSGLTVAPLTLTLNVNGPTTVAWAATDLGIVTGYSELAFSSSGLSSFVNFVNPQGFYETAETHLNAPLPSDVPEPRTLALLGLPLGALGIARRRRAANNNGRVA